MKVPARRGNDDLPAIGPREAARRLIDVVALGGVTKLAQLPECQNKRMMDEVEERARALAGLSPSPLVQTLALTVALCEHDLRARQAVDGPTTDDALRQRHLDRSMRRYLKACEALATIRKKDLPSIQLNVAQNQIVATTGIRAVHDVRTLASPGAGHDIERRARTTRQNGPASLGATPRKKGVAGKGAGRFLT